MSLYILIAHVHILKMYFEMENVLVPYHYPQNLMQHIDFFYMRLPFVNMRDIFKFHNIYII